MTSWPAGARTLVTGATGFIGSHLVKSLLRDGAEVHATTRRDLPRSIPGMVWWKADLADPETASRVVDTIRPDVVFHLASHVSGIRSVEQVLPTFRDNLASTVSLLTAACEAGTGRVVLAGSMEEPATGDAAPLPPSPYAAAKWASTAYARLFHALWDLPVVILHLHMVYGPGQADRTKLVPYVMDSLLSGQPPLLSSGQRLVDWVYVDDVVDAFKAASTAPAAVGKAIPVGSGALVSIRDMALKIGELVGSDVQPVFGAVPDRPLERVTSADIGAASRWLGWRARTPLDTGLARTFEWYRHHPDGWDPRDAVVRIDTRPGTTLRRDPWTREQTV